MDGFMKFDTLEPKIGTLKDMPIIIAYCKDEEQLFKLINHLLKYLKSCTIDDTGRSATFIFKGLHEYKFGEALVIEHSEEYEIVS